MSLNFNEVGLNINKGEEYLLQNLSLKQEIQKVLNTSIKRRKTYLLEGDNVDFDLLKKNEIIKIYGSVDRDNINFDSILMNIVLLEIAEDKLNEKLPLEIIEALEYAMDFLFRLRQPRTNEHWYTTGFKSAWIDFIWMTFNQKMNLDFKSFLFSLPVYSNRDKDKNVWDYEDYFFDALPKLDLCEDDIYEISLTFFRDKRTKGYIIMNLPKYCKMYPRSGQLLLEKAEKEKGHSELKSVIYRGVGSYLFDKTLRYAEELLTEGKETRAIETLMFIDFCNMNQLKSTLFLINSHSYQTEDGILLLPSLYRKIINNKYADDVLVQESLDTLFNLMKLDNIKVATRALYCMGMINGHTYVKVEIVNFLLNNKPFLHKHINLWDCFKRCDEIERILKLVIEILKEVDVHSELGCTLKIRETIKFLYQKDELGFDTILFNLFAEEKNPLYKERNRLITIRLEVNNFIEISVLSEKMQLQILKSLLEYPILLDEKISPLLELRKSQFPLVREVLFEHYLIGILMRGFPHSIETILRNVLDLESDEDVRYFKKFQCIYSKFMQEVIEVKNEINEIKPFVNQWADAELYYRLEAEYEHKVKEKFMAESGGLMTMFKQIQIIRGRAFKNSRSENITKLHNFSKSYAMDRRHFINPDKYEMGYDISFPKKEE
jgi:hypothetical protein